MRPHGERRPRLLDLFSGAGGAAMGYHRAGFEVVGVDIKPQPRYPFEFIQDDAFTMLDYWQTWRGKEVWGEFDAIHASPPCQAYAITDNIWKKAENGAYPDLVAPTRDRLKALGVPFVMENVPRSPLKDPLVLCGEMFGLRVIRHRLFETNWPFFLVPHLRHSAKASYGRTPKNGEHYTISGHFGDVEGARLAMGIDWMTREELSQAIPPAYTEYIGRELIRVLARGGEAPP